MPVILVTKDRKSTCICKCFFSSIRALREFYCSAVIFGFAECYCLRQLCERIEYHCAIGAISLLRKQKYHAERSEAYHEKHQA